MWHLIFTKLITVHTQIWETKIERLCCNDFSSDVLAPLKKLHFILSSTMITGVGGKYANISATMLPDIVTRHLYLVHSVKYELMNVIIVCKI